MNDSSFNVIVCDLELVCCSSCMFCDSFNCTIILDVLYVSIACLPIE